VFACGATTTNGRTTGESHFLDFCADSCADGLDCISGVCTRSCLVGEAACGDLAGDATCTNESIEPGSVAVCDVECRTAGDCARLGDGYACREGYCRGGEPNAPSGTGGAGSGCVENWYLDTTSTEPQCSACACGGHDECVQLDACERGLPVYACPDDATTDDISVVQSTIEGDLLSLQVFHGGGCAPHDYSLCYEPDSLLEQFPASISLRLLHDAHDDGCEAALGNTLLFDLQPLSAFGSLLQTPYGMYASGELSCEERSRLAGARVMELLERLPKSCQSAADCETVERSVSCAQSCSAVVGVGDLAPYEAARAAIEQGVCDEYAEAGCPRQFALPCIPPRPGACVEGRCIEQ
jgi:hypothetical protein